MPSRADIVTFHDPPVPHDDDPVGPVGGDGEVVGHEQPVDHAQETYLALVEVAMGSNILHMPLNQFQHFL